MSERAGQLSSTANRQITDLVEILSTRDEAALRLPCPGREKLGDGTVGASAQHVAHNYRRIGMFVATAERLSAGHGPAARRGHRIPRFLQALGHQPEERSQHEPDAHGHDEPYSSENTSLADLVEQLSAAREDLSRIAELTDRQLVTVPPKDSFRFCDGQRTLEQVITGLLRHQNHQVSALKAALS